MAIKINGATVISDSQAFTSTSTMSATGNVTGGNVNTGGLVSATGNVIGGNIASGGIISAVGNISGSYFLGNGSQLTGIDATSIQNGTSNVRVVSSGGNVAVGVGGTSNVAVFATTGTYVTGEVSASGNITGGNLTAGGITLNANAITSNGSTLTIDPAPVGQNGAVVIQGNLSVTGNVTYIDATTVTTNDLQINVANNAATASAANGAGIGVGPIAGEYASITYNSTANIWSASNGLNVGGIISTTGNITGGNILGGANVNATTHTGSTVSVTGNITGGNLTVSTGTITVGNILNANANGVGNIGNSTTYFNTVFAKATSAQYADLAEKYEADADYEPGTVLSFGGAKEVTIATEAGSTRVAGVVSTNPSYRMNDGLEAEHTAMVALQGRVPTKVVGPVAKGDLMVAAGEGRAKADNGARAGAIIGKALENFDGDQGTIEVVVGRN